MNLTDPPRVPPFPPLRVPAWAVGFHYLSAVLMPSESELVAAHCRAACDATPPELRGARLEPNGRTRVALFGYDIRDTRFTPVPAWILALRARVAGELHKNSIEVDMRAMDSFKVNEYEPGASIHMHADIYRYGDGIVTVSVGAAARLRLDGGVGSSDSLGVTMEPGDVYAIHGTAQSKCRHGILVWPDQPGVRYSVVFRRRVWTDGEQNLRRTGAELARNARHAGGER